MPGLPGDLLGRVLGDGVILRAAERVCVTDVELFLTRFVVAYLAGDQATMEAQVEAVRGLPSELWLLNSQAAAAASGGRMVEARELMGKAVEASERHGVPVLTTTELVNTDRAYGNAGPQGVKEEGRYCHPSAHRAVRALRAMVDYAEFRRGREGA